MLFVSFVAAESLERNESKSAEKDPPHNKRLQRTQLKANMTGVLEREDYLHPSSLHMSEKISNGCPRYSRQVAGLQPLHFNGPDLRVRAVEGML